MLPLTPWGFAPSGSGATAFPVFGSLVILGPMHLLHSASEDLDSGGFGVCGFDLAGQLFGSDVGPAGQHFGLLLLLLLFCVELFLSLRICPIYGIVVDICIKVDEWVVGIITVCTTLFVEGIYADKPA